MSKFYPFLGQNQRKKVELLFEGETISSSQHNHRKLVDQNENLTKNESLLVCLCSDE